MPKRIVEDPDELGYDLVEECSRCQGDGSEERGGRMFLCEVCEGHGYQPHACKDWRQ